MLLLRPEFVEIDLMPVTHDLALKIIPREEESVDQCYDDDPHNDEPLPSRS